MLKKILSYGFVEGISKGLNKLILLLLPLPFFLNEISFGKVGIIVSLELMIPLITFLGFERVILRFYNRVEGYLNFRKTIFYPILIVHITLLIVTGMGYFFGIKEVFGLELFPDIFLLILLIYFQGRSQIIMNMLRVDEKHKRYFISRLLFQVLKFLFILIIVLYTKSFLGYLIGGLIASIIINFYNKIDISKETFDKRLFSKFFLFSWPFIFHGISTNLLGNADRFIIETYFNLQEVGLYTFAYSIGSMIVFSFVGLSVYMEPLMYKSKNIEAMNVFIEKYIIYGLFFGLIVLLMINLVSDFLLIKLYPNYKEVFHLIPLIAIAHILYPYYLTSNYRMIYLKRTKLIALLSLISSAINIILNFIFIPIYGYYAAVITTLVSYILQSVLFTLVSNEKITKEFYQIISLGALVLVSTLYSLNSYIVILVICVFSFIIFYLNKLVYDK